jgi:ribosome-associated protein
VKPIARKAPSKRQAPSPAAGLLALIQSSLDGDKAEDVAVIDMAGKSSIADFMVIATGRSQRHVASMAEHLRERVKARSGHTPPVEGLAQSDWVLVDAGDVVVHLFRPDVRAFYNLEKMWSQAMPESGDGMAGLVKEKIIANKAKKRTTSSKANGGKANGAKAKAAKANTTKAGAARRKKPAQATTRRRAAS